MSTFGQRLAYMREKNNYSKTKIANTIGVGLSTYANWEYGYSEPNMNMLVKLASALNTTTDYLTGNFQTAAPSEPSAKTSADNNVSTINDKNIFSKRLQKLRESKNWSKSFMAEQLEISAQRYSNWEYGTRQPDYEMLSQIATLFDTTADYLIGRTNDTNWSPKLFCDSDLNQMIRSAKSFDEKPIASHDRDVIKAYLQGYFSNK